MVKMIVLALVCSLTGPQMLASPAAFGNALSTKLYHTEIEEQPENPVEEQPEDPIEEQPENPIEEQPENPIEEQPENPIEEQPEDPIEEQPEDPVEVQPDIQIEEEPEIQTYGVSFTEEERMVMAALVYSLTGPQFLAAPTAWENALITKLFYTESEEKPQIEEQPEKPVEEQPETPVEEQPEKPAEEQPEKPAEEQPENPNEEQPENPVEEQPETPIYRVSPAADEEKRENDPELVYIGEPGQDDCEFTKTSDEQGYLLTGYDGKEPKLTTVYEIGESEDPMLPVCGLGDAVFKGNQSIRSFVVCHSDKFYKIGEDAFSGSSLEKIDLYDGVTEIGACAFKNCRNLTELTIPESVESIGENFLTGCFHLTDLTILCDLSVFPTNTLKQLPALERVTVLHGELSQDLFEGKKLLSSEGENGITYTIQDMPEEEEIEDPSEKEEEPETVSIPSCEECLDTRYVIASAEVSGVTLTVDQLGGAEYSLLFHSDGSCDFVLADVQMPPLSWKTETVETEQGMAEAFVTDYYGTELLAVVTEEGLDMDYYGAMLIHFEKE